MLLKVFPQSTVVITNTYLLSGTSNSKLKGCCGENSESKCQAQAAWCCRAESLFAGNEPACKHWVGAFVFNLKETEDSTGTGYWTLFSCPFPLSLFIPLLHFCFAFLFYFFVHRKHFFWSLINFLFSHAYRILYTTFLKEIG